MASDADVWHIVEARRDDGSPTTFRVRELEPRLDLTQIFVVELPYPATELSRMPDASAYRRFTSFEEQWLLPACSALGWIPVAIKIDNGSFFVYLYGSGEALPLIERISPFDGALGFFDEADPTWDEYAALKELLDEAKAIEPQPEPEPEVDGEPGPGFDADTVLQHWTDQTSPTNVPISRSRTTRPTTAAKPSAAQPSAAKPAAAKPAAAKPAAAKPAAAKPSAAKQPAAKALAAKPLAATPPAKKLAKKPAKKAAKKPFPKKPFRKQSAKKQPSKRRR